MTTAARSASGVIGFGWLGQAHARSLARIPMLFARPRYDPELVACADPAPGAAEEAVAVVRLRARDRRLAPR